MNRRDFIASAAAGMAGLGGCRLCGLSSDDSYAVSILGDTHYDAEPESVYHSHYDESNRWAAVQHAEFKRNGEMWRTRCPRLLAASASIANGSPTRFVLQLGDIIQGDCDDVPTHKKMLNDCIKLLRAPYSADIPFLTVVGNHDFRGKGARPAYFEFAEPFMAAELKRLQATDIRSSTANSSSVKYPAFSFRTGPDLWVFCDFEMPDLSPVADLIDADAGARHVFLVTHGPFTAADTGSFRWRLGGRKHSDASRPRLYEILSRRHAVVLSGHTHTTTYWRHENRFGGFCEFTANSVWSSPELATGEPKYLTPGEYGAFWGGKLEGERLADFKRELDWFRPGVKEYFFSHAAGHCRLNVSASSVFVDFYPGCERKPACRFSLV